MSDPSTSGTSSLKMAPTSGHLQQCLLASGPWHSVGCAAEALHGFLARRFVTTIVVVSVLAAASWWWF